MVREFEPARKLSHYIESYWSWTTDSAELLDPLFPDAAPEFIVHLEKTPFRKDDSGDWRRQPRAFLYCAAYKTVELSIRKPMRLFAIRFRPWGVGMFSSTAMSQMLDREVLPGDAFSSLGLDLERAIREASGDQERVDRVNAMLRSVVQQETPFRTRLDKLLNATGGGLCSSAQMAQELFMSNRSFQRLWNDVVGLQPRRYVQLMRFHRALEMIEAGVALKEIAAACGFSDQAHMARQIRSIADVSPSILQRRLGNAVYQELYASRQSAPWLPNKA